MFYKNKLADLIKYDIMVNILNIFYGEGIEYF